MRITFYDTRVTKDYHTMLVKEKSIDYEERINNPKEIAELMRKILEMDMLGEEHCYMLALNNKNRILGVFLISKGTINQSIISAREVFMRALLVGASHIILCHNHPSKDCTPSNNDFMTTKRFKEAGELMGIPLLDHLIIGGDSYFSFNEAKML